MPNRPAAAETRQPALDGLRAVAVALVMAYHGGVTGVATAGFYGVDVFFVLSGYLITTLLLAEGDALGRIRPGAFWGRRARRLLPGLLVMLAAVDIYVGHVAAPGLYPGFRGDALSVVGYFSNWHIVAASSNYFSATGVPSLLTHTWSLAIEEQFYLLWPLLLWAVVRLGRRLGRHPAWMILGVSAAGAAASAAWMAALYRSGAGLSRLYYGTDTHAQSILVGAALAAFLTVRPGALRRISVTPVALAAGAVLAWAVLSLGSSDPVTYQGGFLVVGLASATLIAVLVSRPAGPSARLLSRRPVAYLGRISYGMYLWYFPLFAVVDRARTGLTGGSLFALRCGLDVALAAASFHLVEQPVRRWRPQGRRLTRPVAPLAPLALGVCAIASVAGLVLTDTPAAYSVGRASVPATTTTLGNQPPKPLRILVIGDSTAWTMAIALALVGHQYALTVDNGAIIGCGFEVSARVREKNTVEKPQIPCYRSMPSDRWWPTMLQAQLARARPDAVVLEGGRWDIKDRLPTGTSKWTNITEAAGAADVRAGLELAVSIPASLGIHVAVATAPCFASGEQPDGSPWPDDDPQRVQAYNTLVRSVVAAHPGQASVLDLNSLVCPGGVYREVVDGVTVRAPDGVHYPRFSWNAPDSPGPDTVAQVETFGNWVAPRILPVLRGAATG